ncbi:ComG operon protein 7 [Salinibacillus kushneri]|uniref:ComG operon protein 7 n=1 Tax=Salinibacillus kushneri TaxID=237682 RepID=A0A1I0FVE8_9BACI|nr:competence type IV pilus minor pilin ComGG [Salinibacillus kushneri]SET62226.1 ComG operon protein 7 [Salinibacillus kushneri]
MNERFTSFKLNRLTNEKGYTFPYLFFIFIIIFLITHHALQSLTIEAELVHNKEENIHLETLFLSAYNDFHSDLLDLKPKPQNQHTSYTYPDGHVKVTYFLSNSSQVRASFFVETDNQSTLTQEIFFSINHQSDE